MQHRSCRSVQFGVVLALRRLWGCVRRFSLEPLVKPGHGVCISLWVCFSPLLLVPLGPFYAHQFSPGAERVWFYANVLVLMLFISSSYANLSFSCAALVSFYADLVASYARVPAAALRV